MRCLQRPSRARRALATSGIVMVLGGGLALAPIGSANAVTGAAFTTVNETVDGTGHCQNGNPNNNCNIYDAKEFVWLSGGPATAYVGDGEYFFAVLAPGGQADPNDGADKNLSDDFDAYGNRTYSVADGVVTYSGSHDFDSNRIRLFEYADTPNPGGVYILAICSLGGDGYPVDPSDCKYDAFKVGNDPSIPAQDLTITKDAEGSYDTTWTWDIAKSADKTEIKQSDTTAAVNYGVDVSHDGGTISNVVVSGTITVFNPNADPVDIDGVTDTLSDGTVCSVVDGGPQTVGTGKTDFTYTCSLDALPSTDLDNTAAVDWSAQVLDGGDLLAGSSADFSFHGGTGSYVSFDGTSIDNCVDVTDTNVVGSLGSVCASDPSPTTFSYSLDLEGTSGTCTSFDNTATFTTNSTATTGDASESVEVCVGADLTVSKTVVPTFSRSYLWSINKSVDKTRVEQSGGSATFNYQVAASQTGFADSAWAATGKITISNPNDWEAITANVADIAGTTTCTRASSSVTVPASSYVDVSYSCAFASGASGTNTATATWDSSAANTPTGSASGTAGYAFTTPTTAVNKTVHITDTYAGALGTLTATDAAPYTTHTYSYSRTVTVPTWNCASYANTATITETGQSSSKTVTVCGPAKTGALTIGYWQNKNGQGIITGGASVSGVCKSGTWLRQYAPFQDLSATASCAQTATYVTNIIKAANSSGSSMNPMLKAQMLATALDVYFSDPALGTNKIAAPAPIGGVKIDLTKICKMIDGSGGAATCSGTYQNVSAAFGGAASLTVSQMLSYAASQSNAGGSTWYANVKATQELAKNAFDAINNQVAFSAP